MNPIITVKKTIAQYVKFRYDASQKKSLSDKLNHNIGAPRIYLFSTPIHSNLGDQAQLMCWLQLFNEWYPDHEVFCIPATYRQFDTLRIIHKIIKKEDKIFVHSGYLIFDPHPELPFILDVVRAFYDHPITILPQTVNLMDEWYRHIVASQFNQHPNLTLICRDEVSLQYSEEMFPKINIKLMPDVVTSLIGNEKYQFNGSNRKGVLLCVRNDGEKLYTPRQIENLKNKFVGVNITQTDTTIKAATRKWDRDREILISNIVKQFSNYQVIITDRYHGTIFSQVANTPVIVLSSTDHKLSSGVKWFPQSVFGEKVFYVNDLDEAYEKAKMILDRNGQLNNNPPYFKNKFYSVPL